MGLKCLCLPQSFGVERASAKGSNPAGGANFGWFSQVGCHYRKSRLRADTIRWRH